MAADKRPASGVARVVLFIAVLSCSPDGGPTAPPTKPQNQSTITSIARRAGLGGDPVIVAAGNSACSGAFCPQPPTASLISALNPDVVLPLGDIQLSAFNAYGFGSSVSWASFRSISRPTPGDDEYLFSSAAQYFDFYNGPGVDDGIAGDRRNGYYSYDLGAWHIIALNSNCGFVGGCDAGSPQELWLRADLAAHPAACTLAYWHHSLFSSGWSGGNSIVRPLWDALYELGADVVLTGDDVDYERFAPQSPAGTADPANGITAFVVGTGGKQPRPFPTTLPNSVVRNSWALGVLRLALHDSSYDWAFVPTFGDPSQIDVGTANCNANRAPAISISSPSDGAQFMSGTPITFTAAASDAEDGALPDSSIVWSSDISGELGRGATLSSSLANGNHTITATAVDARGATASATITLSVRANQPPTATISAPTSGSTFARGVAVTFSGIAFDADEGPLAPSALTWKSSIDGPLGSGPSLTKSTLSVGTHTITLTVVDARGASGVATATVTIAAPPKLNQPPSPAIASPANGTSIIAGTAVTFAGSATDPEDGALSGGSLVWTSNRDGTIGIGQSFATSALSVGNHVVTLTATDSRGASATSSVAVTIVSATNRPPQVDIFSPLRGTTYAAGAPIPFNGSASDPEDGVLSGASLVWASDRDGIIGTGTSFTRSTLSIGTHAISLTARDANGATSTDWGMIVVVAVNQPPTVSIASPGNLWAFSVGTMLTFSGSGSDPEDGPLAGNALVWSSDRDGVLGTGATFTMSTLSVGRHVVTLSATDARGARATASHTIFINTPTNAAPTVSITLPIDNATFPQGTAITLAGVANDAEDGMLGGGSLNWVSDIDGGLDKGASTIVDWLSPGRHTITLWAVDSQGRRASASRTITITANPLVANFTYACTGLTCTFDASSSTRSSDLVQYSWSFGGDIRTTLVPVTMQSFGNPGTYAVTLTLTDLTGRQSSTSKQISVNGLPPIITPPVITPPVTGGTPGVNEPSGVTTIEHRAFNCLSSPACEGNWLFSADNPADLTIVQDASAPRSPPYVAQQMFTPALPSGSSPATVEYQLGRAGPEPTTLYMSTWIKLSSNFQANPSSINKQIHFFIGDGNKVFLMAYGSGNQLLPSIGLQGIALPYYDGVGQTATTVNLLPNRMGNQFVRGQWHNVEIVLVANTPGVADGSVAMWLDGVQILSYTGIAFIDSLTRNTWQAVQWSPTWGGLGGVVQSPFYMQMDDMYLSGR